MAQYELSLRDYWRVLRKRRWIILFIFCAIFISTFVYNSMQPHIYQASSTVRYTEQRLLATLLTELIQNPVGDVMLSQSKLIESWNVAELAAKSLGWIKPDTPVEEANRIISFIQSSVDAKVETDTDLIVISVQHTEPQKTSQIANALAQGYQQYNLMEKSRQASNLRQTVESRLSQISAELSQAESELQKFKEQNLDVSDKAIPVYNRFDELKKEEELLLRKYTSKHPDVIRINKEIETLQQELGKYPSKELTFSQLKRNIDINNTLYSDLKQQFERARIAEGEKTSDVTIVNLALTPTQPIKPNKTTNQIIGFILGLLISISAAFLIEHLDTSIGTIEDVEEQVKLPVIGVIPYLSPVSQLKHYRHKKGFFTSMLDATLNIFSVFRSKQSSKPEERGSHRQGSSEKTDKTKSSASEQLRFQLVWNYSPTSPLVESYRTLRTNILGSSHKKYENSTQNSLTPNGARFNGAVPSLAGHLRGSSPVGASGTPPVPLPKQEEKNQIIIITSTGPQEGKTITSCNLAITMASKGEPILLVDMDMRKPTIHKIFGLKRENGLSDILIGSKKLDDCLHNITDMLVGGMNWDLIMNTPGIDNLHIITAGTTVSNASELLSRGADSLFNDLRSRYKHIICDCPPVLPVTDVLIVGPKTDLTALVYRAGKTAKNALLRATRQVISSQINVKGLILNYISPEIEVSPTYYYHYYKYYPSDKETKESESRTR